MGIETVMPLIEAGIISNLEGKSVLSAKDREALYVQAVRDWDAEELKIMRSRRPIKAIPQPKAEEVQPEKMKGD